MQHSAPWIFLKGVVSEEYKEMCIVVSLNIDSNVMVMVSSI